MPDQKDEFPAFIDLFANLVDMRTPMAPEASGTAGMAPDGAPETDQEEMP